MLKRSFLRTLFIHSELFISFTCFILFYFSAFLLVLCVFVFGLFLVCFVAIRLFQLSPHGYCHLPGVLFPYLFHCIFVLTLRTLSDFRLGVVSSGELSFGELHCCVEFLSQIFSKFSKHD